MPEYDIPVTFRWERKRSNYEIVSSIFSSLFGIDILNHTETWNENLAQTCLLVTSEQEPLVTELLRYISKHHVLLSFWMVGGSLAQHEEERSKPSSFQQTERSN